MKLSFIELDHIPVHTEVVLAYKRDDNNPVLKWFIEYYGQVIGNKL